MDFIQLLEHFIPNSKHVYRLEKKYIVESMISILCSESKIHNNIINKKIQYDNPVNFFKYLWSNMLTSMDIHLAWINKYLKTVTVFVLSTLL